MFKIITIPFDRNKKGFDEEVLTKFILNKQVTSHHVQFFEDGAEKYWSVFLEYDPVLENAPEKEAEGLDEPQTILLERLRAWRKERERLGETRERLGTSFTNYTKGNSIDTKKVWRGECPGKRDWMHLVPCIM